MKSFSVVLARGLQRVLRPVRHRSVAQRLPPWDVALQHRHPRPPLLHRLQGVRGRRIARAAVAAGTAFTSAATSGATAGLRSRRRDGRRGRLGCRRGWLARHRRAPPRHRRLAGHRSQQRRQPRSTPPSRCRAFVHGISKTLRPGVRYALGIVHRSPMSVLHSFRTSTFSPAQPCAWKPRISFPYKA